MGIENTIIGKLFTKAHDYIRSGQDKGMVEASKETAMDHFFWTEEDVEVAQEVLSEAYAISARQQIENGETPSIGQRITGPEFKNILNENEGLVQRLHERDMHVDDVLSYNSLQPVQVRTMLQSSLPEFSSPEQDGNYLVNG